MTEPSFEPLSFAPASFEPAAFEPGPWEPATFAPSAHPSSAPVPPSAPPGYPPPTAWSPLPDGVHPWPPQSPPRRWRPWMIGVAAAVVLVVVAVATGTLTFITHRPGGGLTAAVSNKADAAEVVHAYWPAHEAALATADASTLSSLVTGPALRWEVPAVRCGCYRVPSPRPLLGASYFLPPQQSYPRSFLAEVDTEDAGTFGAEILVFTQQHAGARWLVAEDSGFSDLDGTQPELDQEAPGVGDDARPVPAAQQQRAAGAARAFAALWARAKDTGVVPASSQFAGGETVTDRLDYLARYPQGAVQSNGLDGSFSFSAEPGGPLIQVLDAHGVDLACQPVDETVVYTSPNGVNLRKSPGSTAFGPDLAPGTYRSITSTDVWQTCFAVPPSASDPIVVLDQAVGGGEPTGTPADGSSV